MLYKVLEKKGLKELISGLISNYEVIGPKKVNEALHDFVSINDPDEIDFGYKRTTLPPAKKLLFPSCESLINYKLGEKIEVKPLIESSQKVLFGISPWDMNGMNFLDRVFSTDFIDDNYLEKRKKLIVIGYDAEPSDANFAPSVNSEVAKKGFDLFISDIGKKYFIRVATPAGSKILDDFTDAVDAKEEDFAAYNKFLDEYKKKFRVEVDMSKFHDSFEAVYSDNELWEKLAKKCFSCGSCNLVCPTCFCFNVRDDMLLNLKEGIKSREWDSCMIPEYGLVAGGHNFRPSNANRLKQRYRCKLKTFVDKYDTYACVGCGRCVEACLAKINIYEDINTIKKEVKV
jgi:ferredoxin